MKLIAFTFILIVTTTFATTYYVDNQHAQADDTNPGTATQPLKTISAATNKVAAGDMVIVKEGTYNETVIMRAAGEAGKKITFKADPRRKAKAYRFMMSKEYTRVEGFELSNPGGGIGVNITADNVEVVDNYIHDMGTGIGTLRSDPYKSNMYVAHNYIYYVQQGMLVQARNSLFEFNEVERLYNPGSGDSDYSRIFGENIIMRGNYFHGSTKEEIKKAHVDCFQTFTDNGEVTQHVIVEWNVCNDCHQGFMGTNVRGTATSDFTFRNNVFDKLWAWSLSTSGIHDMKIYNNVLNGVVAIRGGGTGEIKNNIFYYETYQPIYETPLSVPFENNLVAKPSGGAIDGSFKSARPNNVYDKDPLFVNRAAGDFHIKAGSPCIDAGADLGTAVPNDMDDHVRPYGGGYDIGPDEYGSTVTNVSWRLADGSWQAAPYHWLPNPVKIGQVARLSEKLKIRWFSVAGKPVKYNGISTGVYLVRIADNTSLYNIMVIR